MLKKIILGCALTGAAVSASAVNLNLDAFGADFNTFLTSVTHDVAPSLRLGALAGDRQGDASIEHFDLTPGTGFGFNMTDGIGTALRPGATDWTFGVHMDKFVPNGTS